MKVQGVWAKRGKVMAMSVAFLLTSACVNASELNIAVQNLPKSTSALQAVDSASFRTMRLVSPSLSGGEVGGVTGYALAQNVSRNKAGNIYYVTLKEGLETQGGEPVNARYISSYYAKLKNSPFAHILYDVSEINVLDESRLAFVLKKPNPWFWSAFDLPIEKTGPYKVAEFSQNKMVLMPQNGVSPTLNFYQIKDPTVRYLKLQKGEVDILHNDMPTEIFEFGMKQGQVDYSVPSASYTYIGLNLQQKPFDDVRVRKALSMAINRKELMNGLLAGRAVNADSLLLPNALGFWPAPTFEHNLEKARALLAEAGYKNGLTFHLNVTTSPFIQRIAQALQYDLQKIGVDVKITAREWGSFFRDVKKGNFQAYILNWVGPFQGDIYKHLFHSESLAPAGLNRGRYMNDEMDVLIDKMMTETGEENQVNLLQKIQQKQYKEMIYVPLWRAHHLSLSSPNVKGYELDEDGGFMPLTKAFKN